MRAMASPLMICRTSSCSAIGGETVSTTVEGRERYTINLRYPRDLRSNLDQLQRVLVTTMNGIQVPMTELAEVTLTIGPEHDPR